MSVISGASLRGTVSLQHSQALFKAAAETLAAACGTEVHERDARADFAGVPGIAAIVSLSGEVTWFTFIGLPAETAARTIEQFTGLSVPCNGHDIDEAVGELGNTITTQAKAILHSRGIKADISVPAVCRIDDFGDFMRNVDTSEFRCFASPAGEVWAGVIAGL